MNTSTPIGERIVLLADIVRFSHLDGIDRVAARLELRTAARTLQKRGGDFVSLSGDAVFAAFTQPGPALHAALELSACMGRGGWTVRTACASGPAQRLTTPSELPPEIDSPAAIEAHRLLQLISPGEVATSDLLGRRCVAQPLDGLTLSPRVGSWRKSWARASVGDPALYWTVGAARRNPLHVEE